MSDRNVYAVFTCKEKVLQELNHTIFSPEGSTKLIEQLHYTFAMLVNLLQNDIVNTDSFILELQFPPKESLITAPNAGEIVIRPFPIVESDEKTEISSHSIVKVKNKEKNEVSVLYPMDIMKQMLSNFPQVKSNILKLNNEADNVGNPVQAIQDVQTDKNSDATTAQDLVS